MRRIKTKKRGFDTRSDAFNLILKSNFDLTQQKMKKIDIFFHSLWFLMFKYYFFQALPVSRDIWNSPESIAPTFS